MEISFESSKETLIIAMKGELDHFASDNIKEEINKRLTYQNYLNIIFNFYGVSFMDSSGIGMLIGRYREVDMRGGRIAACCINRELMRIFDISGIKNIIRIFDSVEEALKYLAA